MQDASDLTCSIKLGRKRSFAKLILGRGIGQKGKTIDRRDYRGKFCIVLCYFLGVWNHGGRITVIGISVLAC